MELNSKIVEAKVMHHRLLPKRNRFRYGIFTFQLDLDELDRLGKSLFLLGRNRRRLFSFNDSDHLNYGYSDIKENFLEYIRSQGVKENVGKVVLVTNLRVLGYAFNPVSFYFAEDESGSPICAVAEVGNTFGEMKLYFLGKETSDGKGFRKKEGKYFYVSPFVTLDSVFDFRLFPPKDGELHVRIDALEKGNTTMVTTYTGRARELSDLNLLWMFLKYPLVTLKIIGLIHWQAFKLYLYKVPFIRKKEDTSLQIGVHLGKR